MLLATLCLLGMLAVGFAVVASREIARAGRAERDTAARHRFLAAFDERGAGEPRMPSELLVQTFETIAARTAAPRTALRRAARLEADLGLSAADIEDAALLVTARCQAHLPDGRDLDAIGDRVRTVDDFVRFLAPFVETAPLARAA
jgi:hypothetical protein